MNIDSAWLPSLLLFADSKGDWNSYVETVYDRFKQDFVFSMPRFGGTRLALKRHPIEQGKEATFWHLISEGGVEAERTPDLRRCERIAWVRALIEAASSNLYNVRRWSNVRRGETRVVLALEDFSYVVVLADRGEYILPWTAFCVEREHQKRKLRLECERYHCENG